jgi:hypothetical protein
VATSFLQGQGLGRCCVLHWMQQAEKGWLPREMPLHCNKCLRQVGHEVRERGNKYWFLYQNEEGPIMRCELCQAEGNLKEVRVIEKESGAEQGPYWVGQGCLDELGADPDYVAIPTGSSYGGSRG